MKYHTFATAFCGLAALVPATGVTAGTTAFIGTGSARAIVMADATCQPFAPFRGQVIPGTGSGTSNLGAFTYTHNVCTQGNVSPSYQKGTFAIDFANGGIFGTFTGETTMTATPGVSDQVFTYLIGGGTGRYLGATGTFGNIGTVDFRSPPSKLSFNFDGAISAAGVPEPAAWALLILGFGAIGAGMRRRPAPMRFAYS